MALTAFDPTDEIALNLDYPLLRPPGLGVFSESSGTSPYSTRLHQARYGSTERARVEELWRQSLSESAAADLVLIGIPTECGSGSMRGAAYGPTGIREAVEKTGGLSGACDLGDILCIPHLLHDDMLNETQILQVRDAVFKDWVAEFPVSPLSITECVIRGLLQRRASAPVIISLGGDHSVTGAILPPFIEKYDQSLGVLHIDAHSDLADRRFGISLTYSSWIMHVERRSKLGALAQFGLASHPDQEQVSSRLLQVGASGATQGAIEDVVTWLSEKGIQQLYVTIDIDATDQQDAPATGLPARHGLKPDLVLDILIRVSTSFDIVGADIVEVAPPLGSHEVWADEPTCRTAAQYLTALVNQCVTGAS
jgi:arginase family enzyme